MALPRLTTPSDDHDIPLEHRAEPDPVRAPPEVIHAMPPPQRGRPPGNTHRLLPFSAEAEDGVLCGMMIAPDETIPKARAQIEAAHFSSPANSAIYNALLELYYETSSCDLVALTQWMRDQGTLAACGGAARLTELYGHLPTVAQFSWYLEILLKKAALREIIRAATAAADAAYEHDGDAVPIAAELQTRLGKVAEIEFDATSRGVEVVNFRELMAFDPRNDPNEVLGHRWLCRGSSALWVGQSGIGKSSFTMQACMYWGMGRPLFGVAPSRGHRMRSLVIQCENDLGDMAEMGQGVIGGFPSEDREALIETWHEQIIMCRVTMQTGRDFARLLAKLVRKHKPDLVWIDPLLSYVGDDISKQAVASDFLNALCAVQADYGIVLNLLHHTGKPSNDPKARSTWTDTDFSYSGFGSSVVTNTVRAVTVLQGIGDGRFSLRFAKRGKRAGALSMPDAEGKREFTDVIWLKHADRGIYWEQIEQPTEDEIDQAKEKKRRSGTFSRQYSPDLLMDRLSAIDGLRPSQLLKELAESTGIKKSTFYNFLNALKKAGKVVEKQGQIFRKTQ